MEKCDWCGKKLRYKPFDWEMPDGDIVKLCAGCILKGDGTVEDLTLPGD